MEKVPFGKTGYKVSRLGFGIMRLPSADGGSVDFEASSRIIRTGIERGVNIFDSHHFYHNGQSEEAVGKAIEGLRREDLVIQTKIGMYNDYSESECRRLLDKALKKLGTDYIDFYLSHSLSWQRFLQNNRRFMKFTKRAMNEGTVRLIGFSSHDNPKNIIKLIDTGLFSCVLLQYNYLNRENEEALAHAAGKGMGVSVMGPAGGGMLIPEWENRKEMYGKGFSSPAELALKFVFSNRNVNVAFSGMSTVGQVLENTAAAYCCGTRSDSLQKEIELRLEREKKFLELYCTGCGYCMPCPSGVNIPVIFEILNLQRVYGFKELAGKRYKKLPDSEKASSCAECGECEDKCPQKIPVKKKLSEAVKIFKA